MSWKAIFLFPLCCCVSGVYTPSLWTLYLIEVFYQSLWVASVNQAFLKIWKIFLQRSFWGVCLQDSQGFSFDKSFFNTWRVIRDKMCVLEGFRFLFKFAFPSRIDFSLNLVPLYTTINLVPRFYLLPVGENPGNEVVQPYLKTQTQCQIFRPWIW